MQDLAEAHVPHHHAADTLEYAELLLGALQARFQFLVPGHALLSQMRCVRPRNVGVERDRMRPCDARRSTGSRRSRSGFWAHSPGSEVQAAGFGHKTPSVSAGMTRILQELSEAGFTTPCSGMMVGTGGVSGTISA